MPETQTIMRVLMRLDGHPTPVDRDGQCWFCGGGLGHGPHGHRSACPWTAMRCLVEDSIGDIEEVR